MVFPCLDRYSMEIRFELSIALHGSIHSGKQLRLVIDGHHDIHFHQDPEDIVVLSLLHVLGHPQ